MIDCLHEPQVSVIMPLYNGAPYVRAALESIMAQTLPDWEALVIDDCSNDDGPAIVSLLAEQEPRIQLIQNTKNQGAAASRNRGIKMARGRYIAFLDCDDQWQPEKLSKQLALMKETGCALSCTSYQLIQADGSSYGLVHAVPAVIRYKDLLKRNIIGCSTAMVETVLMQRHLMNSTCYHEDYATWLELMQECQTACGLTEPLTLYRYYPGSRSHNKLFSATKTFEVYRVCCKMGTMRAAWQMLYYIAYGLQKYAGRKWTK